MLHDPNIHYLDNAATTMVNPEVIETITKAMAEHWANPSSLYTPGAHSELALNKARADVARTLGATAGEVYFTGCGSEGNNLAILGAARTRKWGKRIVCTGFEHPSVALPMQRLAQEGYDVQFVAPEADGHLNVDKMLELVDKNTILVAAMQVNNETGTAVDVARLAAGVKARNDRTAVHVDGVQAWMRVPVRLANIDSYSVSGHKIHAPKGIGALYLRKGYHIEPPYLGGGQEKGMRPGTENLPYAIGMAKAATLLSRTLPQRHKTLVELNTRLREGLKQFPEVTLNSPEDAVPEVLNFSLNVIRSETMLHHLETMGVYVSSGSACSKGAASHTLTAMGLEPRRIDTAIRASFCADNTPEDVDALLEGLKTGLATLSRIR
ncbi:MAG: cysteine desulfurase family protein [Oscillospiraceae bacterium]|nr:cysteine desulfurase family protein [Oscillospiraceae bacterium]